MTIPRFKHLTEQALPTQAHLHHWPIRLDHCFKRICLDHAFQDIWHHHIPRSAALCGRHPLRPVKATDLAQDERVAVGWRVGLSWFSRRRLKAL